MAFMDFLFGSPARQEQISRFTPQQLQMLNQGGTYGMQGLQNLAPQYQQLMQGLNFDPIEQNAMRQFQQTTIPSLAERFSGMGAGGSQRSSAFAQSLGGAGADLMSQLGALRAQYGLQRGQLGGQLLGQQGNIFGNLASLGMQPQFDVMQYGAQPGLLPSLLGGMAPGFGYFGSQRLFGGDQWEGPRTKKGYPYSVYNPLGA
jgi:hypothetical protein